MQKNWSNSAKVFVCLSQKNINKVELLKLYPNGRWKVDQRRVYTLGVVYKVSSQ